MHPAMWRDTVQRVTMLFTGLLLALPVSVAADGVALLPVKQFAECRAGEEWVRSLLVADAKGISLQSVKQ